MQVKLRNDRSGEIKMIGVGWSWMLFLFSGFLGVPLFLRRLYVWGGVMLALWVVNIIAPTLMAEDEATVFNLLLMMIFLGLSIFFGLKGNELTAKNLLEQGWEWVEPDAEITAFAKAKWQLA